MADPLELLRDLVQRSRKVGLSPTTWADESGVSLSLIYKIQAGYVDNVTLETFQKLTETIVKHELPGDPPDGLGQVAGGGAGK